MSSSSSVIGSLGRNEDKIDAAEIKMPSPDSLLTLPVLSSLSSLVPNQSLMFSNSVIEGFSRGEDKMNGAPELKRASHTALYPPLSTLSTPPSRRLLALVVEKKWDDVFDICYGSSFDPRMLEVTLTEGEFSGANVIWLLIDELRSGDNNSFEEKKKIGELLLFFFKPENNLLTSAMLEATASNDNEDFENLNVLTYILSLNYPNAFYYDNANNKYPTRIINASLVIFFFDVLLPLLFFRQENLITKEMLSTVGDDPITGTANAILRFVEESGEGVKEAWLDVDQGDSEHIEGMRSFLPAKRGKLGRIDYFTYLCEKNLLPKTCYGS